MTARARRDAPLPTAQSLWAAACRAAGCPQRTPVVEVALAGALGEVLATPLAALIASPPGAVSAMDGIAVVGDADRVSHRLAAGAFAPVDTGQPVPPGFDAVAPIEVVTLDDDGSARIDGPVPPGANVRAAGEHLAAGQPLLPAGRQLTPLDLAIAIAGGHATAPVHRRPRVAVVPTGDELRPAGAPLEPGTIHDSNGPMIAAQVTQAGAQPFLEARSADDEEAIAARIAEAAEGADLVLLLGGSSRGRRDHAGAALRRVGEVVVDGVAIRPGHPVLLGVAGATPVVGVPGYPMAAAVVVHVLVLPLLRALRGLDAAPPGIEVELADDVDGRPGADAFVPLRLDRATRPPRARALGRKGSDIASLAAADALLRVPPSGHLAAGAVVAAEALG